MPRKKLDEAARVVAYFEGAPLPAAHTVLSIVTAIVARRLPATRTKRRSKVNNDPAVTDHNGILVDVTTFEDPHD